MSKTPVLIDEVALIIEELSVEHADAFRNVFKTTATEDPDIITDLNKHFRGTLASLPVCTIDARDCLMDNVSKGTWKTYFADHVVRLIVRHQRV